MDMILIAIVTMLGIFCMGFGALRPQTNGLSRAFAFGLGIPWLIIYFFMMVSKTGPTSPLQWQGETEMGPVTLILIVLGICWHLFGADYEHFPDNHK